MSPSVPKAPEAPVEAKPAATEIKTESQTAAVAPTAENTPAT